MGLKLTSIIFPAPKPSYNWKTFQQRPNQDRLYYIKNTSTSKQIPFLFLPSFISQNIISSKCIIYFHGNGQDLGYLFRMLYQFRKKLKINILAMQYSGYGVRSRFRPDSDQIKQDSKYFYNFVKKKLGFTQQNIIILGRSIGSGPACYLASQTYCKNLILISPFKSIRNVARSYSCLYFLVYEHFNNGQYLKKINSRLLVIHGQRDEVIDVQNSRELERIYNKNRVRGRFIYVRNMSHNNFNLETDILNEIEQFKKDIQGQQGIDYGQIKRQLKAKK